MHSQKNIKSLSLGEKKIAHKVCVFSKAFPLQLLSQTILIPHNKNSARYHHKCTWVFT